MGVTGGYTLHLYCDEKENCTGFSDPGKYSGRTKNIAKKNARRAGWTINENGKETENENGSGRAVCPRCSGK